MQVLEKENIGIDLVVGSSGGAVFGAAIAMGYSSKRLLKLVRKRFRSMTAGKSSSTALI
jgi:predicted acylesterase/phospholipase RssA